VPRASMTRWCLAGLAALSILVGFSEDARSATEPPPPRIPCTPPPMIVNPAIGRPYAHEVVALCYERYGDLRNAIAEARSALHLLPTNSPERYRTYTDLIFHLSDDLYEIGEVEAARHLWRETWEHLEAERLPYRDAKKVDGDALFRQGKYRAAFAAYYDSNITNPQWRAGFNSDAAEAASPRLLDALHQASLGQFQNAITGLRALVAQQPDFQEVYYYLGNALYIEGERAAAIHAWRKTLLYPRYRSPDIHGPDEVQLEALGMLVDHA
jgi:tetratricopeptide (TPR) repeat protein